MLFPSLNRPFWPFLSVFVLPVVAGLGGLAITTALPDCGLDEPWWEAVHVRLAFLPGLLNLAPLAWLFSPALQVRQAAGISGLMGLAQLALPQAAVAYYAAVPGAEGQATNASCTVSSFLLIWLIPGMIALWLICVIMGLAILLRRKG